MRGDEPERGDSISVPGLIAAFRRRLRLFGAVFVGTNALVIAFLLVYPARYTATARVTINTRAVSTTPDKETPVVGQLPIQSSADVDTETQVIQSRNVVQRVVETLRLDKDPDFASNKLGPLIRFNDLFAPLKARSKSDEIINNVMAGL